MKSMKNNRFKKQEDDEFEESISESTSRSHSTDGNRRKTFGRCFKWLILISLNLFIFINLYSDGLPDYKISVYNQVGFAEKPEILTPVDPVPTDPTETTKKENNENPPTQKPNTTNKENTSNQNNSSKTETKENPPSSKPQPEPVKEPENTSLPVTQPPLPNIEEEFIDNEDNETGYIRVKGKDYRKTTPNLFNSSNPLLSPKINQTSYIDTLEISLIAYDADHLNVVIRDAQNIRYEIPNEEPYPHVRNPKPIPIEESNFKVYVKYEPFDIIIIRKTTGEVIFKLTDRLVYTDLYLEFSFYTPTNHIYGFGERLRNLQFTPGTYTLFMLDQSGEVDPGKPGYNQQGHHSMYMMREKSGNYHVNLLRNINAQEIILSHDKKVTWRLIGGVIDLNFFLGESPEEASRKYHKYLGGWTLPALWHLGHHQSKFQGYMNADHLAQIIKGFEDANLPLESLWSDLDYTIGGKSFVLDQRKFPPAKVNELYKTHRKRWIPIVDPWIFYDRNEVTYDFNRMLALTMKDSLGSTCTGTCLSGKTVFIDFLHPDAKSYWQWLLEGLDNKWSFSGIWLDANEITNYLVKPLGLLKHHKYFNLPFYPGIRNFYEWRVVAVDCVHYGGVDEYNVRSIPSLLQSKYTYEYLQKKFPFPLILSRATMFSGGQYAYTWVPDVNSNWGSIIPSLGTTLSFALFGIPMVGVDICGFIGDSKTPSDLCARWYQLAVFYPFARNAHTPLIKEDNFQEPYRFSGEYYVAIVDAIKVRYSIIKYLLALFFSKKDLTEARGTGTIMRPLFFGFYNDSTLPPYGDRTHDEQFLLGDGIMAAPVLRANNTSVDVYFPNCRWFDLRSYREIQTRGKSEIISANFNESVPHFLRGGHMLFKQDTTNISNSEDLSEIFTVVIGLRDPVKEGKWKVAGAEGEILGVSNYSEHYIYEKCAKSDCILSVKAEYKSTGDDGKFTLKVENRQKDQVTEAAWVNEIYILGAIGEFDPAFTKAKILESASTEVEIEVSLEDNWIKLGFSQLELGNLKQYTFIFTSSLE